MLLLGGDFNARVGGGQSLHSYTNDNGQRLADMCSLYGLAIGGLIFQHKDIHKGTWRSPDGRAVTQIDHLCIGKKWQSSLLDVRAYRGADIGSDHYLVLGRLKVKLSAHRTQRKTRKILPALENLRNQSKVQAYNIALSNRFLALSPEESLDAEWDQFKEVVESVSLEVLGTRPRRAKQQHLSQDTWDLITQRSTVKRKSPEGGAEYSRLNKLVKKSAKADDQRWADNLARDLEEAASHGNQREVWQRIKNLSGKKKRRAVAVRDAQGAPIPEIEKQRERWAEHFSNLLNPQSTPVDLMELDEIPVKMCFQSLQEDDHPPVREEVLSALSKLKNHKSPGIDGICNEQLKYGAQGLTNPLLKLFGEVWESERVPEDWLKGVITIIPKKGDTSVCSNNRGITLRSTTSKLFQMVILGRLSEGLEVAMRENQCGFRKNRSCVDQIYFLRAIIRQCTEHSLPLYVNFIDFKSAFDCINRDFIWKAFRHYGLPEKYVRVLQAFFDGTVSAVRHDGELLRWLR